MSGAAPLSDWRSAADDPRHLAHACATRDTIELVSLLPPDFHVIDDGVSRHGEAQ